MHIIHGFLALYDVAVLLNYANTLSGWTPGRQGTGYDVLYLKDTYGAQYLIQRARDLQGPIFEDFWDAYLIRYQEGQYIQKHKDEAAFQGKRHRRINAIVQSADEGGQLIMGTNVVSLHRGDAVDFYPDEEEHEVTKVEKGMRLVFSVGCWQ